MENIIEVAERLRKACDYLKFEGIIEKQSDLAKKMGRQRTNVSSALNGSERYLTDVFLESFSKIYNIISLDWLLTGEGEMLTIGGNTLSEIEEKEMLENDITIAEVPVISYTTGKPYYDVDLLGGFDVIINDQTINPEYLINFKKYNDADCWCNITGHSMEPLISNGDIIAIKEMREWREFILYGELYGIITNDMRTVKIVTKSTLGNEFLQLVPANKSEEYQPQDIPVKLITHVFKILGCMKKL